MPWDYAPDRLADARERLLSLTAVAGGGAELTATVSGGAITAVAVADGGSGYDSAPTILISDPTGRGAILEATVSGGAITSVAVTDGGSGYVEPGLRVVGLGMDRSAFHYPRFDVREEGLPACVLDQDDPIDDVEHAAPGESSGRGSIRATFYAPASMPTGVLEQTARDIAHQAVEASYTDSLVVVRASASRASVPRRGKEAAAGDSSAPAYCTFQVVMEWEG